MKRCQSLLIILALLLGGCGRESGAPPADVRTVRAEQVAATLAAGGARYAGEVRARHETVLAFLVPGRIASREVDVGTPVKTGQLIATLDPADYALAVRAGEARLTAAETEAALAQQDLARFTKLRAENFISQAELDRRRTTTDAAQARVRQLRAELAQQVNRRSYTRLTAPHTGVMTAIDFEAGQVVEEGQPLARLARGGEEEIRIDVPENAVAALRAAESFTVRLWALPDRTYAGRLRELSPMADAASRTYSARISLLQPDAAVRLGMTATVEAAPTEAAALSVPQSALFRVNGQPQVWVVDRERGEVAARSVEIGALAGDRAAIAAGLASGEWVVTAGVHKLAPGQRVRVMQP
ncbi:MAG TPA: efflux RND transporter periplasmic adaptor subunit [Thiobacillaceae bacterium]|nr:efflux RND transporter periplasmic adaptor subunit [Thiobacillaceae bacterium]